jgi:hypothetical protein
VRDRNHALPLDPKKDKRILVIALTPTGRKGGDSQLDAIRGFADLLRQKGFDVDFRHDMLFETQGWTDDAPSRYDRILVVAARMPHTPFGPMQLWDDEAQTIWGINALPKQKIIVVSLGTPYLVNEYFQRVNTCINAYSNTPVMHRAVIRALLGETPFKGISPVDLSSYDPPDSLGILHECRPRNGLPHLFEKLKAGRPVTIAYLGGSITQAAGGYREQSAQWLQKQYPNAGITAINAGVGGTGSDLACFRLRSQALDHNPDLVFVEFAVNDKNTDTATIHETMEGIVRQIRRHNINTDICFVYTMTADMEPILAKGKLPAAARAMEDIADYYRIPSIDMCSQVVAAYKNGDLVFQGKPEEHPGKMVFSPDNVHPYAQTGHRLYTEAIARSFITISVMAPIATTFPLPTTPDRLENVNMIPASQLETTGRWSTVQPSKENAGVLTPEPFPSLIKTTSPGAGLTIHFTGTGIGLYDVVGPGTAVWNIILDGKQYKKLSRFDAFATYWRPNYILVSGLPAGPHTVEFRLAGDKPDKRTILAENGNTPDFDAHPDKYHENAGYAGFLLLAGSINNK